MKQFIIKAFLLIICTDAYSQLSFSPGSIVLRNGDTLRGEIRGRGNQLVYFRTNSDASSQAYKPEEVIGYQEDGINHLSVSLTEEEITTTYFMREQINGYISLYTLFQPEGRLTSAMRLPDKTFVPLRGNLALLMLTNHLTKCSDPSFSKLLNPQSFFNAPVYFERVINTYNECVDPAQSQRQSRPKSRFRYEAGLSANALMNSWLYGAADLKNTFAYYNPNGVYSSFYTATIGAFFTVAPRKRLSASVEFLASQYKGSLSVPLTNPLDPTVQNPRLYSFEEHFLALPILGRYVFLDRTTRWYLKAGVVLTMRTSISGRFSDAQYSIEIPFLHQKNVGIGYLAGIGADIALTKKHRMYVEFRTMPHFVLDAVSRIATSRSLQVSVSVPLIKHQ
ncbi:outer membrane beta-barrel protein [Spirosoma sp. HMF3257]|uniref:Uncharacterized protein n=1 Tax=Spirosoma telluris TaxID=2183553 RepID=A0A327NMX6_9BACT|nr:outer membrane beta-barrel protein [Spirosoma telluris]RAI76791.1 hypothetical protein HMF3257_26205 [Spirosoma telluris]